MKKSLSEFDIIVADIRNERYRQDKKWGPAAERNLPLATWQTVLSEEFGEVGAAILHGPLNGYHEIRDELIQVAATAIAMIEALENRAPFGLEAKNAG